jgi:hypothetical protein
LDCERTGTATTSPIHDIKGSQGLQQTACHESMTARMPMAIDLVVKVRALALRRNDLDGHSVLREEILYSNLARVL